MTVSITYDEYCPLCKEEIDLEIESGFDPEPYECECGAVIEFSHTGSLSMVTS